MLLSLGFAATLFAALAQEPAPAWPRRSDAAPFKVALYEPQVESYDQDWMTARAALSVATNGAEPVFGAVWFGMRLTVDAAGTLGRVTTLRLDQMRFPEGDLIEKSALERLLSSSLVGADLPMEPLLASLARDKIEAEAAAAGNQAVPDILFTTVPVALVRIEGEPELKALPDADLLAVINSNTPIFLQKGTTTWFMQVEGRWLSAAAVTGPWKDADGVPDSVKQAAETSGAAAPGSAAGPQIVVVTRPTEVVYTDGEPRYAVIPGTGLLYVKNTEADLFLDIVGQKHYALLAGRWFAAMDPQAGPWEVVSAEKLPSGFAVIPETSPKFGVLAHVPGTTVAREAVQDAEVPRTQAVKREVKTVAIEYEGEPEFVQAGTTTVYYAVNTPHSVLRLNSHYYLCDSGVWYYGVAALGPWTVCVDVPGVIYTIPPACPIYPVTYVRVYDWTPDVVYCGYTSGYLGWYVGGPALVFGLAYYDYAWWGHHNSHYYYHHNYRCGYYPQHHGGYDRRREHWDRPPVHRGGDRSGPSLVHYRPGPEYHMTADSRPRAPGARIADRPPARPNRYDQEPSSSLARRVRGNELRAAAKRSPEGMPATREARTERTPPARNGAVREQPADRTPPARNSAVREQPADRTPPARDRGTRDERANKAVPAPQTAVTPEAPTRESRPERTPQARERPTRESRDDKAVPAPQAVVTPEATTRGSRSDKTTPASQPPTRREPVKRDVRGRTPPAATPTDRTEGRTEGAVDASPATASAPAARPETKSAPARRAATRTVGVTPRPEVKTGSVERPEATPSASTPRSETRTASTPRSETRTASTPRSAASAPVARTAPTREASAASRRVAPAAADDQQGVTTGVARAPDERRSQDGAASSASARSRRPSRDR
jgi:hypothetical protein